MSIERLKGVPAVVGIARIHRLPERERPSITIVFQNRDTNEKEIFRKGKLLSFNTELVNGKFRKIPFSIKFGRSTPEQFEWYPLPGDTPTRYDGDVMTILFDWGRKKHQPFGEELNTFLSHFPHLSAEEEAEIRDAECGDSLLAGSPDEMINIG